MNSQAGENSRIAEWPCCVAVTTSPGPSVPVPPRPCTGSPGAVWTARSSVLLLAYSMNNHHHHHLLYLLKAYSPVNRTGSPQSSGPFTSSNLPQVEYNTKHAHYINITHTHMIPSVLHLYKMAGYAGTIDSFGLAFQYHYQTYKIINKEVQKQLQINNTT